MRDLTKSRVFREFLLDQLGPVGQKIIIFFFIVILTLLILLFVLFGRNP